VSRLRAIVDDLGEDTIPIEVAPMLGVVIERVLGETDRGPDLLAIVPRRPNHRKQEPGLTPRTG
jgi:hypothetical protein